MPKSYCLSLFLLTTLMLGMADSMIAQPIPQSRRVEWSSAGLSESAPPLRKERNAKSFGALGDGSGNDGPAIQAALDALDGLPGMVWLPPGTYRVTQSIDVPAGAVLRGAGADSTRLLFNFGGLQQDALRIASFEEAEDLSLMQAPRKGKKSLILTPGSSSGLQPGDWVEIVQDNGAWDEHPAAWAEESVGHISRISSMTGDTLILDEAFRLNLDAALAPRLRRIEPIRFVGVECLALEREEPGAGGNLLRFYLATDCWVRGVESIRSAGAHALVVRSAHLEFSGNFFHQAWAYDGVNTRGYGISLTRHSSACLIEDNVFRTLRHAMMVKQGANGNVFSYNYSSDPVRSETISDFSGDVSLHGHYPFANLFEGNIVQNIFTDNYWGPSGPGNTFYRNRTELYGVVMTSPLTVDQTYVGNHMSNPVVPYGNLWLTGSGHWLSGNLVYDLVEPPGSSMSGEASLYRQTAPAWWSGTAWPGIGFSMEGSIPAYERFHSAQVAVCRSARCHSPRDPVTDYVLPGSSRFSWLPVEGSSGYSWRGRINSGSGFLQRFSNHSFFELTTALSPGLSYSWQVRTVCEDRVGPPSPWMDFALTALRDSSSMSAVETELDETFELPDPSPQSHSKWKLMDVNSRVVQQGNGMEYFNVRGLASGWYLLLREEPKNSQWIRVP